MGYSAYRGDKTGAVTPARVVFSELESESSGYRIGRLDLWPAESVDGVRARSLILESNLDAVIVRCSSDDVSLAASLQCEELVILQADTLLYFEVDATQAHQGEQSNLRELTLAHADQADYLISEVFADYRNHWSASPIFAAINVQQAYRDWARRSLAETGLALIESLTGEGESAGVCLIDERDAKVSDILLAGVLPGQRRRGAYQSMMRSVIRRAAAQGRQTVAISTQAANIEAMRAWYRVGLLPTIALNTLHAIRRDRFPYKDGS